MIKHIITIPAGFEVYKIGNKEIYVRKRSCFNCHYCKCVACDTSNYYFIIQCKHEEQWKNDNDMTDKGIKGTCPKWEEVLNDE